MKFFALLTEVAGHLDPSSSMEERGDRPMEFVLDDSFSDCILSVTATYFVTDPLKQELQNMNATGVRFGEVHVTLSEQYLDNTQKKVDWVIPHLNWLIVDGTAGKDDCGTAEGLYSLVVSERVLSQIQKIGISFCRVKEFATGASYGFWGPFEES